MVSIEFQLTEWREDPSVETVVAWIDGLALTDRIHEFEQRAGMESRDESYGGLIPSFFRFGPAREHFYGRTPSTHGKVPLLGCECGEWGCWPLLARIVVAGTEVTWTDFEQPHRPKRDYTAFGPFTFSRAGYDGAVEAVANVWDSAQEPSR